MNIKAFTQRPEAFALCAALLNGTIGPLNRFGFDAGGTHFEIAFFKCLIAFLLLLCISLYSPKRRANLLTLKTQYRQLAFLAFLGIFGLYFFETWAFSEANVPMVSFLTYAAGGATIILSAVFLNERITRFKVMAFVFILAGVFLIFIFEVGVSGSMLGIILALLGGLGYALFIFFSKLFNIGSSIEHLVWLFGFGCIYLLFPWMYGGFPLPNFDTSIVILLLVLLPTIGGFWFTTHAVTRGDASSVQIIETSDPLFASLFALLIFGDALGQAGVFGALFIFAGILFAIKK